MPMYKTETVASCRYCRLEAEVARIGGCKRTSSATAATGSLVNSVTHGGRAVPCRAPPVLTGGPSYFRVAEAETPWSLQDCVSIAMIPGDSRESLFLTDLRPWSRASTLPGP